MKKEEDRERIGEFTGNNIPREAEVIKVLENS